MAMATIIEDLTGGKYSIQRNWAGREAIDAKIVAYNSEITRLQSQYDEMPETTEDEIFKKRVVQLQIEGLKKTVIYFTDKFPDDETVEAWCADFTEGLSGQVGTIDIAGEKTEDVNIRPARINSSVYSAARDGELYPGIALGPWTSLLNEMIYPGWQKFKPLHRYGVIINGTIDHETNTCVVAIRPTYSLMNYNVNVAATGTGDKEPAAGRGARYSKTKNYNVNFGDTLGEEEVEFIRNGVAVKGYAREFFIQNSSLVHPGFLDFVERNPDHPISKVQYTADPVVITDEQFIQIRRICSSVDAMSYLSDQSGYDIGDYWNVMMDIGDPWYWTPYYQGEPQSEMFIGDKELTYNLTDEIRPKSQYREGGYYSDIDYFIRMNNFRYQNKGVLVDYHTRKNMELELAMRQEHAIIMPQARKGDCEDFALTKMQAIIEAGIVPAENLQILLCYVLDMGYHAVLGIQTANKGFLISDILLHGGLFRIENLSRHQWSNFSVATDASGEINWSEPQVLLKDVPFEYMRCDSVAFLDGDDVVVEFTNQDWTHPKIIGFRASPRSCSAMRLLPDGTGFSYTGDESPVEEQQGVFSYYYATESWTLEGIFPATTTFYGCGTGAEGIVYRLGGYYLEDAGLYASKPHYTDSHWMYDVNLESWESAQNSGQLFCRQRYKFIGEGKAILYGGEKAADEGVVDTITFDAVQWSGNTNKYNFSTDVWDSMQAQYPMSYPASFVIDSLVYIAGGRDRTSPMEAQGQYNDNVSAFSEQHDTWVNKKELPARIGYACGWGFDGQGYVGGGLEMERYQTAAELPGSFEIDLESACSENIFNYYVCPEVAANPLVWWTEGHYRPRVKAMGFGFSDQIIDAKEQHSPPFETLYDLGPPERYVTQTTIIGYNGGFVCTGVGFYYDPVGDVWTFGRVHPSYDFAYTGFAHSEIDDGKKGIRVGGGRFGSQSGYVIDPVTDTWTAGGTLPDFSDYSKLFGSSGIGVAA